ncbi:basic helix-loop-helix protein A-like [Canna indica]|uniref:Basic helix-loop-helix protein A-like n=1 Tax=Canna indica TaxID=4628 RepID=A0AAQ3K2L3_9LILI|nr:basic helix-loop-helix protein A-like [Canna indica]
MAAPHAAACTLQQTLQAVVQSIQWTYSLFWQLCPQQGILVWGDGYYNGAIKTRKTVQPVEVSTEEAALQRSQQLRELYESLSTADANLPARRPCAALSPEDLTEAEWFYLMCISFSFPHGVGLPGKAFAKQRHIWLIRANEVDSKVFSRAILAKTVVCIPVMDGILELGNTEKVEEDIALIQHAKRFFMEYSNYDAHTKSALSEQSTSDPFTSTADHHPLFQQQAMLHQMHIAQDSGHAITHDYHYNTNVDGARDDDDDEQNHDDDDDDEGDEIEGSSRSELKAMRYGETATVEETVNNNNPTAEASELMQLDMSEDMRVGSISDCSNNLDMEEMPAAGVCDGQSSKNQQRQDEFYRNWHFLLDDLGNGYQQSLGTQVQEFSPEDAHYSETVSTIVRHNLKRWVDSTSYNSCLLHHYNSDKNSAFSKWSSKRSADHQCTLVSSSSQGSSSSASQRLLKNILLNIRDIHFKFGDDAGGSPEKIEGDNKLMQKCGSATQEEVSANHVLAERRRREKLKERFMVLRSLMDKASILADTIEYVKQLRRRIKDLESRNKQMESDWRLKSNEVLERPNHAKHQKNGSSNVNVVNYRSSLIDQQKRLGSPDKRKQLQSLDQRLTGNSISPTTNVHVSIMESDALLELQCCDRDGLLLKILHTLHELGLETTSLQFNSSNGVLDAVISSKVKEVQGKRAGIVDVKKAIHQIIL